MKNKEILKKLLYKYNWPFAALFIFCIAVAAISISLSKYFEIYSNCFKENELGVFCQVVTTAICCISSIIGISFSIQDSSFFGISTKDFEALRVEWHLPHSGVIVFSIILIILELAFYMAGIVIAMLDVAIVSAVYCIYVSCSEIPIMTKKEKRGISILRNRLITDGNIDSYLSKKFDRALKYLIIEKNLKTAYDCLSNPKDPEELRKKILIKLLDLQTDIAIDLENISDNEELNNTIECLGGNIRDILHDNVSLKEITGGPLKDYLHYITSVLFCLSRNEKGRATASGILKALLFSIDYSDEGRKEQQDFYISIIIALLTGSVSRGEDCFFNAIKSHYSMWHYSLEKERVSTDLFAIFSLYFYYFCELEHSVPADAKEKLKKGLDEKGLIDREYYKSWYELFDCFCSTYEVNINRFFDVFSKNEAYLEYCPIDGEAHWIVLDSRLAVKWYFTNLLNSNSMRTCFINQGNNSLMGATTSLDETIKYYIVDFLSKCFDEEGNFKPTDEMLDIVHFYRKDDKAFKSFSRLENSIHKLFSYKNSLLVEKINISAKNAEQIDDNELAENCRIEIESQIKQEWGFDENIPIKSDPKYMYLYFEKAKEIINLNDSIIETTVRSFFHEIKRAITEKTTTIDLKTNEAAIKNYLSQKVYFISSWLKYSSGYFIENEDLKEKFNEWIKDAEIFNSRILPYNSAILNSRFGFNYCIEEFSIIELADNQLAEKINSLKRSDGQYVYDGAFLEREQLESILKKKGRLLSVKIRYEIAPIDNDVLKIDLI